MRFSTILPALLAISSASAGSFGNSVGSNSVSAKSGNSGKTGNTGNTGNTGKAGTTGSTAASTNSTTAATTGSSASSNSTTGGVTSPSGNTSPANLGVAGGQAGGALNAGAQGTKGANGLPQLTNGQTGFDATTNTGTFGPFQPVSQALPVATGAPSTVDASTAQALQAAADNWSFDTAQVSNFLNTGHSLTGNTFNQGANIAYNAEVDELTHKAVLDSVIGNDPDVSIANQTLTNGVFQSVVNNLQIMADQGANTQQLIDFINNVRCTQILPSIDTYLAVAARTVGSSATLRTAIRPNTCASIVAAAPSSAFPGNIQILSPTQNANRTTQFAPVANSNQGSVSPQFNITAGASSNTATTGSTGTTGTTGSAAASSSAATAATGKGTTGTTGGAAASSGAATAATGKGTTGTTGGAAASSGAATAASGKGTKNGNGQNARRALAFVA